MKTKLKRIKDMGSLRDDVYLEAVTRTANNLGLDSALKHAGPNAGAYTISCVCMEWLMDGLGSEIEAEKCWIGELNFMIASMNKEK